MSEALEVIYGKLSAPMPKESIQRASKAMTRKGYDTTGIGYQFIVNRFNEVLGIENWWFDYEIVDVNNGEFGNGKPFKDIAVAVTIWISYGWDAIKEVPLTVYRKCVGGHVASTYADALKGAVTNAFKKTAALFGVGKQAYEGTLDDDTSYEDEVDAHKEKTVSTVKADEKQDVTLLTYDELFNKMSTSENVFELNARCKKYAKSYDALTDVERKMIIEERNRRKLYIETGMLGEYTDFKIIEQKEIK